MLIDKVIPAHIELTYILSYCSLTAAEKACIIHVRVRNLIATLEQLVEWIEIGVYDFCHLPLAMKKKIVESDENEIIRNVHEAYPVSGKHFLIQLMSTSEFEGISTHKLCGAHTPCALYR